MPFGNWAKKKCVFKRTRFKTLMRGGAASAAMFAFLCVRFSVPLFRPTGVCLVSVSPPCLSCIYSCTHPQGGDSLESKPCFRVCAPLCKQLTSFLVFLYIFGGGFVINTHTHTHTSGTLSLEVKLNNNKSTVLWSGIFAPPAHKL